jgi:hypothetical protein
MATRRLKQSELHSLFLKDIGDIAENVENIEKKPLRAHLKYPFNRDIKAYVFNCTGPPGGRTVDEWKVQLIIDNQKRGQRGRFIDSEGITILIVGYAQIFNNPEDGVWVLFELDKHREFAYSANIQIYLRQLMKALDEGVYVHKKHNDEIVVIAKREYLIDGLKKRFDIDFQILLENEDNGIT